MVWGGVSQHHQTELVVSAGNLSAVHYREDIFLPHVVPFLQAHPAMTLQHDNATRCAAHSVHDFLQDWPVMASCPEMSGNLQVSWLKSGVIRAKLQTG